MLHPACGGYFKPIGAHGRQLSDNGFVYNRVREAKGLDMHKYVILLVNII